jgi:hypothetical protein
MHPVARVSWNFHYVCVLECLNKLAWHYILSYVLSLSPSCLDVILFLLFV